MPDFEQFTTALLFKQIFFIITTKDKHALLSKWLKPECRVVRE
ncbi:hypothetical protein AO377_0837 [Moraxella catarrhalis]|nr:hypothetical protein AO377_0837 [Moraxella catarrhalis]OAV14980.1 hypothetical protein AO375_0900 [Moraxella catarrhalis]OAV33213.1 hypothetical protein AO365_2019 [Moraxella catarrhalis]